MQVTQEKDTVTQEPVSLGMVDVAVEENPGIRENLRSKMGLPRDVLQKYKIY